MIDHARLAEIAARAEAWERENPVKSHLRPVAPVAVKHKPNHYGGGHKAIAVVTDIGEEFPSISCAAQSVAPGNLNAHANICRALKRGCGAHGRRWFKKQTTKGALI